MSDEQYIIEDKEYFIQAIKELLNLCKEKDIDFGKTKHVAKHKDGIVNIAHYNQKTGVITQYNNVSPENPKGTSVLIYKLD